ncbi:MAG: 3'-5' exonuclease [Vallitaleaceae bacterium]|nr:3'-5' exonuclease [Vallitaleaceae bacterium]
MTNDYIVLDIETTGISASTNAITEIGAIRIEKGIEVARFQQLINPEAAISPEITRLTGITYEMVKDQPTFRDILRDFLDFSEELPLLGHNILFDFSFIKASANRLGIPYERKGMDTCRLARKFVEDLESKSLSSLIRHFRINRELSHRAYHDAKATYELYQIFLERYYNEETSRYFEPMALHWKEKKEADITPKQKAYLEALIQKYQVNFSFNVQELSKSEASRHIDRILFEKGIR